MRTKIIATLGPASSSYDMLLKLALAGVSIFRLNFSHGDLNMFKNLVHNIRQVEKELKIPLTIMQDLSGPKIRLGILKAGTITVRTKDHLILGPSCEETGNEENYLTFDHLEILAQLELGDRIVLADGGLQCTVIEQISENKFVLQASNGGIITSKKGLALPGKSLPVPAITQKDRLDLKNGLELGVDAVAISYVQRPEDILELKALMKEYGRSVPTVAKLERQNAVNRLDEIVAVTDIIMVARGDLGVECDLSELPAMQKRIIKACNKVAKPVIVATQMLLSMVNNPAPTRAETTDVANAVIDGADCVMLSEETAMGNYPVETVAYMRKITNKAEEYLVANKQLQEPDSENQTPEFLAYTACLLANKTKASAIVAHSISGTAARLLSSRRPAQNIYALTPNNDVLHELNFSWGICPIEVQDDPNKTHLSRVEEFIMKFDALPIGQDVLITAGEAPKGQTPRGTNLVKIYRK